MPPREVSMSLIYAPHEKLSLRRHPVLNEAWLHDRICDNTALLGFGDIRVLDRERPLQGGGRLDLILQDDENSRRYEVEIQLGPTDPSHIIRTIEYWDLERRRYPAYEHVAVIVAEDITTRFLNVISLMSGSIPLVAIQLDALRFNEHVLLNFVQVLDLTALREDDEDDDGGGTVNRAYWEERAGSTLMRVCDEVLALINKAATSPAELNYRRGYIGLRTNGVVRNPVHMSPKPMYRWVNIGFRCQDAADWKSRFEQIGVEVQSKRANRFMIKVTPDEFRTHIGLIEQAIAAAITED